MSWNLFIDDERFPKDGKDYIICRTMEEAIKKVQELGIPVFISFDHDLGEDPATRTIRPTALDFAHWMIGEELDGRQVFPEDFKFVVHSANPVGRDNIISLLNSYLKQRVDK